jgi:hypothetical protein
MVAAGDVPVVRAGAITPMMNFAHVRVTGTVVKAAYVSRQNGVVDYCSFPVDDGSGWLRVAAYDEVARRLAETDGLPKAGVAVDVRGRLSVRADRRPKLCLQAVEHLECRGVGGTAR